MTRDDFRIGLEFYTAAGRWRCTDVGTRVIAAIQLDQEDPGWSAGPPYAVVEWVLDEYDLGGCSLDLIDVLANEANMEALRERVAQARSSLRQGRGITIEQLREKYDIEPRQHEAARQASAIRDDFAEAPVTLPEGVVVDIAAVDHAGGYRLRLTFSDGTARTVDFEPFLRKSHNRMIRKYLDPEEFADFSVQYGDLVWHDYDLCFPIADLYEGRV